MNSAKEKKPKIDDEINHVLVEMAKLDVASNEYAGAAVKLKILCEARSFKDDTHVSREYLIGIGTSIFEVMAMLWFEQANVITSKVLSRLWHSRS